MRALLTILARLRPSLRGGIAARLARVMALAALSGFTAGVLPAVMGVALNAVLRRPPGPAAGLAGLFARLALGLSPWGVIAAELAATLASVAVTVYSSRRASELAGEVTAALRIEMLRAVLHASPRDVDAAGQAAIEAKGGKVPPAPRAARSPPCAAPRSSSWPSRASPASSPTSPWP